LQVAYCIVVSGQHLGSCISEKSEDIGTRIFFNGEHKKISAYLLVMCPFNGERKSTGVGRKTKPDDIDNYRHCLSC